MLSTLRSQLESALDVQEVIGVTSALVAIESHRDRCPQIVHQTHTVSSPNSHRIFWFFVVQCEKDSTA